MAVDTILNYKIWDKIHNWSFDKEEVYFIQANYYMADEFIYIRMSCTESDGLVPYVR